MSDIFDEIRANLSAQLSEYRRAMEAHCQREQTRARRLNLLLERHPTAWFRWEMKYAMLHMNFGPSRVLEMLYGYFLANGEKVKA